MKKLPIVAAAAFIALSASAADTYMVYDNGTVNPELHYYLWWNAAVNSEAANPSGSGQALEFKPADGSPKASAGYNMEAPQNTGILHNATLNFDWYATDAGAVYTIRLTAVGSYDYTFTATAENINKWNTISINIPQEFPALAKEWNENSNSGAGYVFSFILNDKEGQNTYSTIYFNNVYYSGVDENWKASASEPKGPSTVPVPEYAASDVFSMLSGAYDPRASFNIGQWGAQTNVTNQTIDGAPVEYLRIFDYLGWVDFNIDLSGYDYMHVDYWTPSEGTLFGFVPISLDPTVDEPIWDAPAVKANEWNSYDVALSEFAADMSAIQQIKFVANQTGGTTPEAYLANVFFYKSGNGGGDEPDPDQPVEPGDGATYTGKVNGTLSQTNNDGTTDFPYVLNYSVTYNDDKTLTVNGKYNWTNGEPVGAESWVNVFVNKQVWYNQIPQGTDQKINETFNPNEEITLLFYNPCAFGAVAEKEITYVVGSTNDTPSGVSEITVSDAPAVYYNLQGVKVANPENGIFIRVQGNKSSKVIL